MENIMEWDDSLNTGITAIDAQHKQILDFINKLHIAAIKGDRDIVANVLTDLINYTISHFDFEEKLQQKHGYPLASAHKKVHDNFVAHVTKYKERHDNGEDIAQSLSGELVTWLCNHIKNEDRDYVPYCNKPAGKGVLSSVLEKS
ncbi:MAG: bacteriohemerythrin [Gammaproteobacteria bacterium]|nr:bacteriohemerythrin [Gammaproteobacteria bacterium]MCW8922885.1 bacteriohemerythrin [Gammaproteobacteria bacterium]